MTAELVDRVLAPGEYDDLLQCANAALREVGISFQVPSVGQCSAVLNKETGKLLITVEVDTTNRQLQNETLTINARAILDILLSK